MIGLFSFWGRPLFRGELLVLGRVSAILKCQVTKWLQSCCLRWQWKVRKHDIKKSSFNLQGLACQGLRVVLSSNAGAMCCKQLSLVFQCLPRTQGIHNRLPNSFTQRDGHEHLNCTCEWICQAFYLDITLGFSWYQHDWCPWFDFFLGISVRACAADPLDATQERNLAVDHLGRQAAMDDLISRGCVFLVISESGFKLERKVNGQQTTCQMCVSVAISLYDCMTLLRVSVYHIAVISIH